MAAFNYAPTPLQDTFFIPGSNTPGNGVLLFTYLAGSTTKTPVYMDSGGLAAHTNPIVLDSGGNLPSGSVIWIPTGITLKAVYAPANDTDPPTSPYRTIDNIVGINDTGSAVSEWTSGPTPTFISTTSFSVAGDQTATFTKYRRVRTTNTGGTIYSTITASSFGGGITTVTVQNDSGVLDSGLSAVSYGIINPANPSVVAGQYTVIPRTTVANTSHVVIVGMSSDVLNTYELRITDYKPAADGGGAVLRLSADGGSTFFSTAVYRTERTQIANGTTAALGTTDTAGLIAGSAGTSALFPFTATVNFLNMADTSRQKVVEFVASYVDTGNVFVQNRGAIFGIISSSITAARITPLTGNISTMTYELFGTRRQ